MPGPLTLAQVASRDSGRIAGGQEVLIRQAASLEQAIRGRVDLSTNSTLHDSPRAMQAAGRPLADLTVRVRSLENRIQTKEQGDG